MKSKNVLYLKIAFIGLMYLTYSCNDSIVDSEPTTPKILFSSDIDGNPSIIPSIKNSDIFIMDSNGENKINLTNSPDSNFFLIDCSIKSKNVLYRQYDFSIYIMNLKDNSNRIIASSIFSNFDASFSSSGNEVIYVKQTSVDPMNVRNDIILVNLNNFVETNLTINNAIEGVYPKMSPDGNKVCFSGYRNVLDQHNIYILDRNGTNLQQLTSDSLRYLNSVFSLDGTQIFCTGFNEYGNEIFSLNINTKKLTKLTNTNFDYIYGELSISPDNKTLLFTRNTDPYNSDIFLIDIDGNNFRQLTFSNSSLNGKFSYDGDKILFIDKVNEVFQIFEMKIDGSDKVNLSNNMSNNTKPIFLP